MGFIKIFRLGLFFLITVSIPAQQESLVNEEKKQSQTDCIQEKDGFHRDVFRFDLGIIPDTKGNIQAVTGFNFRYFKGLNAGASYSKVTRSIAENSAGFKRLAIIEEQVIKVNALGYRIDVLDGATKWWLNPNVNGQSFFQKRQLNSTDRNTDKFQTEDSNLDALQINTALETELSFSSFRFYLSGSATPYSKTKESGNGYDTSLISTNDSQGNLVFLGPTGDYSYKTSISSFYFDGLFSVEFFDLFLGNDVLLEFKMSQLDYNFSFQRVVVDNAARVTKTVSRSIKRRDMTATIGYELFFLDLGETRPLATFNISQALYQDFTGKNIKEYVFGAGITFKN